MKNTMLALSLLIAAIPAAAQKSGDAGVGVVLGAPTGVTGKLWLDGARAFDAGIGWNAELSFYADYLHHAWDVLPQPARGRLPVYVGLGGQVRTFRDAEFSFRAVAGIAYWLPSHPVEFFAELVPLFHVTRQTGAGLDGAVGMRVYLR